MSAQNNAGVTALMLAAENGHEQVALIIAARYAHVLFKQKAKGFWRSFSEIVRWLLAPLLLAFAVAMYFKAWKMLGFTEWLRWEWALQLVS